MNKTLAVHVIQAFLDAGGVEICVCPGSRNSPIVSLIASNPHIKAYYFYEERSAAFFALGRSRRTQRPVAIVTTSGTAAVELMPAITEAYYTAVPLVAITADRPRSYRGTNAPQTCEQVGLYGQYATWCEDLEGSERLDLSTWDRASPAHINVCFQEPLKCDFQGNELKTIEHKKIKKSSSVDDLKSLSSFLNNVNHPLVIVSTLKLEARDSVRRFLRRLNLPVYLEGTSGLREDPSLAHLRVFQSAGLWSAAEEAGYPIDGVLRIGSVPTVRLWRDLEDREGKVKVLSISDVAFSGLSWGSVVCVPLESAFDEYEPSHLQFKFDTWLAADKDYQKALEALFQEEPAAEVSLIHEMSKRIPDEGLVYLGNGLPIRDWDLGAIYNNKGLEVWATRGLSGIDGQVSTFLGLCQKGRSNWAFLGDLTTLYDMSGFWIASQLKDISFNLVIINNGGGQIFSRMYSQPEFLNAHSLNFKALAELWGLEYARWEEIPERVSSEGQRIIELVPDNEAYHRFWDKITAVKRPYAKV